MKYNNVIKNKKKLNEITEKVGGAFGKAFGKISEASSSATESIKDMNNHRKKVKLFEMVVNYIDSKLIDRSLESKGNKVIVGKFTGDVSVEGIIRDITSLYDDSIKGALNSIEYINSIYSMVCTHYQFEDEIFCDISESMLVLEIKVDGKDSESVEKDQDIYVYIE